MFLPAAPCGQGAKHAEGALADIAETVKQNGWQRLAAGSDSLATSSLANLFRKQMGKKTGKQMGKKTGKKTAKQIAKQIGPLAAGSRPGDGEPCSAIP